MKHMLPALALLSAVAFIPPALAQESHMTPQPKIVVTGTGEAAVAPDMAIVTLAVMRDAPTAREAMDQANEAMDAVIAAMREAGIADRDLQTTGLSIQARYVYPQNNNGEQQPKLVAYQVSNTLTVRVRDVAGVGAIVDRAVTLGVNQGGSIVFTNDDPSSVRSTARTAAVKDAMERARQLAEAAGVKVGRILEIAEQGAPPPPMPLDGRMARVEAAAADAVPVAAGENNYRIDVAVTVELDQ